MDNDCNIPYYSNQWVYVHAMTTILTKLQQEVIKNDDRMNAPFTVVEQKVKQLTKVIKDPDGYNTNLASKKRVESLEEKMNELHNKIDSIYSLLETLSDRFNKLEYSGNIEYGEPGHIGRKEKSITIKLKRAEKEISSPNPYGDDDFATPK